MDIPTNYENLAVVKLIKYVNILETDKQYIYRLVGHINQIAKTSQNIEIYLVKKKNLIYLIFAGLSYVQKKLGVLVDQTKCRDICDFAIQKAVPQFNFVETLRLNIREIMGLDNTQIQIQLYNFYMKISYQYLYKMMTEQLNIYSKEEEANNKNQLQCQAKLQKLIGQSKERYEHYIKCCISKQIKVLEGLFYDIIKIIKQINYWEQFIYEIVQISETQQSYLQSHFNRINTTLLKQLKDEQIEQRRQLDDNIFYKELDLQKQKKSHLEKQLQSFKTQLKEMKDVLKLKKEHINEYFLKVEEQQEIKKEIETETELTEEQKEVLYALQICQKDLFQEFGLNGTNSNTNNHLNQETQQENKCDDNQGIQNQQSEFYQKIQEGLKHMQKYEDTNAEKLFDQAIQLEPNNPKAYHCKANSCWLQHLFQDANENYEKAIELDPDYELCYLNYVRNMYKSWYRPKGEADELLQKIKDKFPNCKKARYIEEFFKLNKKLNSIPPNPDKFD